MKSRINRLLSHRYFVPAAIVLGVALCVPSVNNGLVMDDHIQKLLVSGDHDLPWPDTAPWDLYALVPGTDQFLQRSIEMDIDPWWGSESFQATFFRPLSSLTIYLDRKLWPDDPRMMHIHSLAWFALFLVVAALLYKRLLGAGPLFALATLLFVLDDSHVMPATWVANRNSLLAAVFAMAVLFAHDKWRKEGSLAGALLASAMLGLGLMAGEFALGIVAYLFSYAVFMDRGSVVARAASLSPYLVVVVVWRAAYNLLGYGAHGSDLYIDPLVDQVDFLAAAAERLPILTAAQYGAPGSELNVMLPAEYHGAHTAVSAAWVALVALALWPLLKRSAKARFFALGSVLLLVPSCATFPHDRLLILSGLGAMVVVAMFLLTRVDPGSTKPRRVFSAFMAVMFVFFHLVISPVSIPLKSTATKMLKEISDSGMNSIESDPGLEDRTLIIAVAPDIFTSGFLTVWRTSAGLVNPAGVEVLTNSVGPVEFVRADDRTIRD